MNPAFDCVPARPRPPIGDCVSAPVAGNSDLRLVAVDTPAAVEALRVPHAGSARMLRLPGIII